MIEIGPYRFTTTDAERTIRHAVEHRNYRAPLAGDLDTDLRAVWAAWSTFRDTVSLPPRTTGEVAGLFVSQGGLPKRAVDHLEVGWRGASGDRQASRTHHGRPWQALCLWSTEVIEHFRADGHPLEPGFAGENITLRSIPWSLVIAGTRLRIGTVLCEVSAPAIPCFQNKDWFLDGDFMLMHHDRGPVSRMYATVLEPGQISVGSAAVLEP